MVFFNTLPRGSMFFCLVTIGVGWRSVCPVAMATRNELCGFDSLIQHQSNCASGAVSSTFRGARRAGRCPWQVSLWGVGDPEVPCHFHLPVLAVHGSHVSREVPADICKKLTGTWLQAPANCSWLWALGAFQRPGAVFGTGSARHCCWGERAAFDCPLFFLITLPETCCGSVHPRYT